MDITYPRTTFSRLASIASAIVARTGHRATTSAGFAEAAVGSTIDLAPMRRREQQSPEYAGADFLRAGVGPIGPYLGVLRR